MHVYRCTNRAEFFAINDGREFQERYALQLHIAKANQGNKSFSLPGFCRLCNRGVDFLVDRRLGAQLHEGVWVPNWRERLVCPHCGLNNRQRAMCSFIAEALKTVECDRPVVYVMDQRSPIHQDCIARYPECEWWIDGEPDTTDMESLSVGTESVDILVSNGVLGHVAEPTRTLSEMHRVLAPGGVLLMTIPFSVFHDKNVRRARVESGRTVYVMPPVYHENPNDPEGSLVFTDFGWEILDQMHAVDFDNVEVLLYWSMVYGHLGGPLPLFHAQKASEPCPHDIERSERGSRPSVVSPDTDV